MKYRGLLSLLYPIIRGKVGEQYSAEVLYELPDDYKVLNSVMLRYGEYTTQIDHIVFSIYGIFVIETKNYSGLITGSGHSDEWIQFLYNQKHYFKNPIYQNYGHIKTLSKILDLPENKFVSIVAFTNSADLQLTDAEEVTNIWNVKDEIYLYQTKCLHPELLKRYIETIKKLNIDSFGTRLEHDAEVKVKIYDKKIKIANSTCPRCGGKLILRNGKYGNFYGCSNYPKCAYTHNVEI